MGLARAAARARFPPGTTGTNLEPEEHVVRDKKKSRIDVRRLVILAVASAGALALGFFAGMWLGR